jgi:hypothetical protein
MKPARQKTAVRMKEARERLDVFEAQETAGSSPAAPDRKVAVIFWICVTLVGVAIYFFAAWRQRF